MKFYQGDGFPSLTKQEQDNTIFNTRRYAIQVLTTIFPDIKKIRTDAYLVENI